MKKSLDIESIEASNPIHPKSLLVAIAKAFGLTECYKTDYGDGLELDIPIVSELTPELCKDLGKVARKVGITKVSLKSSKLSVVYEKCLNDIERLVIKQINSDTISDVQHYFEDYNALTNGSYRLIETVTSPTIELRFYENGEVHNYSRKPSDPRFLDPKGFLCSMKDLFCFQDDSQIIKPALLAIFKQWGIKHPIWRDLARDFKEGSAYSSIPLGTILKCRTRRELLETCYGKGMKRNNRENIGKGIFLIRAATLIDKKSIQKLYGEEPGRCYIGDKEEEIIEPLSSIFARWCQKQYNLNVEQTDGMFGIRNVIRDTLRMLDREGRKLTVKNRSPRGWRELHDALAIEIRNRELPEVNIPKRSRFRKLELPDNCIRLTSKEQFIEESSFQNNCVASYVNLVNHDRCSIWSMRKEDGTRNTIEILYSTKYYHINQMLGKNNKPCPDEDYKQVEEYIKKCVPPLK